MGCRILPVDRARETICDAVFLSRVVLIVGDTGCGKSTRVPLFLQEELKGKVICSQPRRLAVVAVAKHVAEEADCKLGDFVGYRIGQRSVANSSTRLLFTTAGLLLEDLRANGANALAGCKCVVFDEVHERSIESDLSLECLHQLMMTNKSLSNLKLVLMSATADVDKFKQHFKDLAVKLDVINISNASVLLRNVMDEYKVEERYLQHAVHCLPEAAQARYQGLIQMATLPEFDPMKQVGPDMLLLVTELVLALHSAHRRVDEAQHAMLVFLPTYRALESLYQLLQSKGASLLDVYVLHSTLDTEECVRSMEVQGTLSGDGALRRKVIIATSIAESSITIPGVKWVIDTCVTNEISWSESRQTEEPKVVWASRSQCRQRQGRTGRTGSGIVYHLMPRNRYMNLERFERPAMLLKPLRRETLVLMSAADRSLRDVRRLLSRCMDPPPPTVVDGALQHLLDIGALEAAGAGGWQVTPYGQLVAALPISSDTAAMVLRGGQVGLLWEAAVLASIICSTPYPIKQPFGDNDPHRHTRMYLSPSQIGRGDIVSDSSRWLANLSAFEFWQRHWCDPLRSADIHDGSGRGGHAGRGVASVWESLRPFLPDAGAGQGPTGWAVGSALDGNSALLTYSPAAVAAAERAEGTAVPMHAVREAERRWCEAHDLIMSALHGISDTMAAIHAALQRYRPVLLSYQPGAPEYYHSRPAVPHVCRVNTDQTTLLLEGMAALSVEAGVGQVGAGTAPKCLSAGSIGLSGRRCTDSQRELETVLKPLLRKAPLCSYFASPAGCRSGALCRFFHEGAGVQAPHAVAMDVEFEDAKLLPVAGLATQLASSTYPEEGDMVLLLGDGDLSFSASLCAFMPPGSILATSMLSRESLLVIHPRSGAQLAKLEAHGSTVEFGINAERLETSTERLTWSRIRNVVWNFPHNGVEEDQEGNRRLMAAFFKSLSRLAVRLQWDGSGTSSVALVQAPMLHVTLCNDQYSRWGMDMVSRAAFWFSTISQGFVPEDYAGYMPRRCPADAVKRAEAAQQASAANGSSTAGTQAGGRQRLASRRGAVDVAGEDDGFKPDSAITFGFHLLWPQQL